MLQHFDKDIWIANGSFAVVAGFKYPTRMVIIRLTSGELFIWSPIALSDQLRASVDALGPVRHVVAPNTLHYRFVDEWRATYPDAKYHAVPGLRARRPDVVFDCDLEDTPAAEWSEEIDQVIIRGNRIATEAVFFHRKSRTVIFTDLIQHFDRGWFTGWRAAVARLDLLTAHEPTVPQKFRMAFSDRSGARKALQQILSWPAEKLLAAHAPPIERDGRAVVARAFEWLLR